MTYQCWKGRKLFYNPNDARRLIQLSRKHVQHEYQTCLIIHSHQSKQVYSPLRLELYLYEQTYFKQDM